MADREKMIQTIKNFKTKEFYEASKELFHTLSIPMNEITHLPIGINEIFEEEKDFFKYIENIYTLGMINDEVFQNKENNFNIANKKDYEGILIFLVELNSIPNRTTLSNITRAFNKEYHYTPVVVIFKYDNFISLANTQRVEYKQSWREGEKIAKVTILRDIDINNPHRGHIDILSKMKISNKIKNYDELYKHWQEVFDVSLLNKQFYQELSNWYFYSLKNVKFPNDTNEISLIRLLTRIIFVWFLKEKNLINEELFDETKLKSILKDEDNSVYYKAILQNLFFATLNTPINKREFATNENFHSNKKTYGVKNLYRYDDLFTISKEEILKLFENIPFLNGGLFECLDITQENGKVIYFDGFSRNKKQQPIFPNELFFGKDIEADLNEVYGTKNKKYKVNGLITILNSYKFTIAENTPIEEDVALDPELLGRVFENLLASYNPETNKTARKLSGSYYTPREIVEYMVDKTLISYLSTHSNISIEKLENLFSYETEHILNNEEVEQVINLLDNLKMLDPAVGSGAYPMGILHKTTHILHKIDPENIAWKKKLFEVTPIAFHDELEKTLKNSNVNYARKLHIIQNTIFGVDIQPIAIQISKLRFFISLVIEQNPTNNKNDNFGITPLPNLDTKFVCANSLLLIEKKQSDNLFGFDVEAKEKEIIKNREKHFYVKNRTEKLEIIKKDKILREELSKLLTNENLVSKVTAELLAKWNPYDPNSKADFFDSEFMFGIKNFDIVIGNPPYVRADSGEQHLEYRNRILDLPFYKTLWEKWDLYVAFIEMGYQLLKDKGVISYIIPSAYLTAKYGQKSREYFVTNAKIERIDFLMDLDVFEASVKNIIFQYQKDEVENYKPIRLKHKEKFGNIEVLETDFQENLKLQVFNETIKKELNFNNTLKWGEIFYLGYGLTPSADEKKAKGLFKKDDLISDIQDKIHSKPYIEGKDIKAYQIERVRYLEWGTDRCPVLIRRKTFPELYENERIILGGMTGGIIDNSGIISNHSTTISTFWHNLKGVENKSIKSSIKKDFKIKGDIDYYHFRQQLEKNSEKFNIRYCLAILNSTFAKWCFNQIRRSAIGLYPDDIKQLPIKIVDKKIQNMFKILVDYIMFLKRQNLKEFGIKYEVMPHYFEQIIDGMVYELYFEDLLKKNDRDIIQYLDCLEDISDINEDKKLETIKKVYDILHDLKHPVRNHIFYMDGISEIRTIEESK